MADEKHSSGGKEPQSYGSEKDWVTGKTGQTVDRTPQKSDRHDEKFYESRHESDRSPAPTGGQMSPQRAGDDHDPVAADTAAVPAAQPTAKQDGAGRGSFFKNRDYGK